MLTTTETYLVALLVIFILPWAFWRFLRTDHYAPLVVVQIVGGIVLGPGVLGVLMPEWHGAIFSSDVIAALNGIAWWAVMLFVFVAGVELDLSAAWLNRRETALTAGLALVVPLALGSAVGALILTQPGWQGKGGTHLQALAGIGMACSVTALPILVLLMEKMGIFREALGQRLLRYASLDDIAIWAVLALILLDMERIAKQGAFLLAFALCTLLIRAAMRRLDESDRWYLSLGWLALAALAADWAGLHFMVGAFLAGCVLDTQWFAREKLDRFREIVLLTIMPVFFLSTGLRTDFSGGGWAVVGVAALLLAAAVAGKLAGVHLAGRLLGWKKGEAWVIGWMLQTKALIMIIFANVLLDKAIIAPQTFTALLLMAVGSTMLTVPIVTPRLARLKLDEQQ